MGVIAPAPPVLGTCSIVALLEALCAVHLVVSIIFVCLVDSIHATTVVGVEIDPLLQSFWGTWCLIGIPVIIYSGIGILYHVESHLNVYIAYLLGTLVWGIVWIWFFETEADSCWTDQPTGTDKTATYVCGLDEGVLILWGLILLGLNLVTLYLAWSAKVYIRERLETELIRYAEPWRMVNALSEDIAAEEARELVSNVDRVVYDAAMPAAMLPRPWRDGFALNTVHPPLSPPVADMEKQIRMS